MKQVAESIARIGIFVKTSFELCNLSFGELWYLTQSPRSEDEIKLSKDHTLHFYGVTLQYCFIMEYTKLLEKDDESNKTNIASLFKLNNRLKESLKVSYENKYAENSRLLEEIINSSLCKKIKDLRNQKFGHADGSSSNNPFSVKGFTGNEIDKILIHIKTILKVMNNCLTEFEGEFLAKIPHHDKRTANFIKYHAVYQKYYHDNYEKAYLGGYKLNNGG